MTKTSEKTRIKLHVMMDVVLACINRPFDYYVGMINEDVDDTEEYDEFGRSTSDSNIQMYQSRVSILDKDIDADGKRLFQIDIAIRELFMSDRSVEVNAGFTVHETYGVNEVVIYVTPEK